MRAAPLAPLFLLAASLAGCVDSGGLSTCGNTLQACCAGSCNSGLFCEQNVCTPPGRSPIDLKYRTKVDLVFMVDDSPSMEAMAAELRTRFGDFFGVFTDLAKGGFYADLHVGVVTSDFGAGNNGAPGCDKGGGGRMGRFQPLGRNAPPSCAAPIGADYVQYLFGPNGSNGPSNLPPGQSLLQTFTCMASVGASGCGMEHPLESTYAALHNPPAGFLRSDAVLAVVFLTNEDDCSADFGTDLFDESKVAQYGYFDSYRCTRFGVVGGSPPALFPYADPHGPIAPTASAPNPGGAGPGKLWDLSRYTDFFGKPAAMGGVKADPGDVILVGIDAPEVPASVILADPNAAAGTPYVPCSPLNEKGSPACVPVLQHSCINASKPAFFGDPAIRLNAVIDAATHHTLSSICEGSYAPAMQNLGTQIASQLGLGCVGAKLPSDSAHPGQVKADCTVVDLTQANGQSSSFVIPQCSMPATAWPCWRIETKPGCAAVSPQSLGLTIDRNGAPTPPGANIKASCVTL